MKRKSRKQSKRGYATPTPDVKRKNFSVKLNDKEAAFLRHAFGGVSAAVHSLIPEPVPEAAVSAANAGA
jgi:hypothetical protein